MTLCVAWVRDLPVVGSQVLLGTDSMITGGFDYPHGAKLFAFARDDCGICWEGEAFFPYTMISNIRNDVDYSDLLSSSASDIASVVNRSCEIINQLWQANLEDPNSRYKDDEFSFIFAGYSYRREQVQAWHIRRAKPGSVFEKHHIELSKPYFIGSGADVAAQVRIANPQMLPQEVLQHLIDDRDVRDVGGVPQFLSIDRRGVEIIGVVIDGRRCLFGRELRSLGHLSKVRYVSSLGDI